MNDHYFIIFSTFLIAFFQRPTIAFHEQCLCIPQADGECIPYNSKYMAMSLEEAIDSFPDLSMHTILEDVVSMRYAKTQNSEKLCTSDECQACQSAIRRRLSEIGLMEKVDHLNAKIRARCNRYSFTYDDDDDDNDDNDSLEESSSQDEDKNAHNNKLFSALQNLHQVIKKASGLYEAKSPKKQHDEHGNRQKRQISPILGNRYNISCTTKGKLVDANGYISLCSSCWAWRKLPDNYLPRYINELICDESDDACLSGYASCSIGWQTLRAFRNDSGVLKPVTLQSGTFCECKVKSDSNIDNLISGQTRVPQ